MNWRAGRLVALVAALMLLAACESREERAERHYQSALALMAEGDVDRALVELRNVFVNDGFHREARQLYADTVLARGDVQEAYSQYLRLIEQYPDTVAVRQTLAELAIGLGNWDEVTRHGTAALELAPDDARSKMLGAVIAYRQAAVDQDVLAKAEVAGTVRELLAELPDSLVGRQVLVDSLATGPDPAAALPEIAAALALDPDNFGLHALRVQILGTPDAEGSLDTAALDAALTEMGERFPDNPEVNQNLLGWYMSQGDQAAAEALLRRLAGADDAPAEGHVAVVQFLAATQGPEAARAELERLTAAADGQPQADLYRTLAAAIDFEAGRQTEAIAAVQALVDAAEPGEQTRQIEVSLARMLEAVGDRAGAEALVERVIAADASNVPALMMRAVWRLLAEDPDGAISDLRIADSQAPRNPEILTLMAEAHERAGDRELAAERLALAVEASGNAAGPTLRYAEFLLRENRPEVALAVLTDARRVEPTNLQILGALADLWLAEGAWSDLDGVLADMVEIGSPEALAAAQTLQAAMLVGQSRTEDSLAYLDQQIAAGTDADRARAMMAVIQIRSGNLDQARNLIDARLTEAPDDLIFRYLSASLYAINGQMAEAEATYRGLMADDPGKEEPFSRLYTLLLSQGQTEAANAVLAEGLAAVPGSGTLRWIEAGRLEQAGDAEGAIAIYEALYAEDSTNLVVANNLASLLAAHRTDPAQITRAAAIARRLRGIEVPAFQDTWGWLQHLDGKSAEALPALTAAAEGLPEDAQVRAHLGIVQATLALPEAAATLTAALELAGDSPLPVFEAARRSLAGLPTETGAGAETGAETGDTPPP
jgi:tetratricopeptide (TPR) repeat protein